jgi:hypothetical protein
MFEELLKKELARCCGYSRQALNVSFANLVDMAKKEFHSRCHLEPWTILSNLSKVRNRAAHFRMSKMPFGDIVPQALRQKLTAEILGTPCMEFLQPRLSGLWKFITQFTYMHLYYCIRAVNAPGKGEELAKDFRKMLEFVSEYLNGPDGDELLAQIESR